MPRAAVVAMGAAPLLLGCTDYDTAVDCAAVFAVQSEAHADGELIRLRDYAARDARKKSGYAEMGGEQLQADIEAAADRHRHRRKNRKLNAFEDPQFTQCWNLYQ